MKILFTNVNGLDSPLPTAAKTNLPEWYQKSLSYIDNKKASTKINNTYVTTATIKKCMPVFDVITAGYFIYLWSDIGIENINGVTTYRVKERILDQHNIKQALNHPAIDSSNDLIPKFINPFTIKTPKGYSCLFIPPAHRNNIISIMPAVVDTDTYNLPIHFPFTLTDSQYNGVIEKGTPLVQVIPFKREEWEIEYGEKNQQEYEEQLDILHQVSFNSYKNNFWHSKDYI